MPRIIKGWKFETRANNMYSEIYVLNHLESEYEIKDIKFETKVSQKGIVWTDIYTRKGARKIRSDAT